MYLEYTTSKNNRNSRRGNRESRGKKSNEKTVQENFPGVKF